MWYLCLELRLAARRSCKPAFSASHRYDISDAFCPKKRICASFVMATTTLEQVMSYESHDKSTRVVEDGLTDHSDGLVNFVGKLCSAA